MSITLTPENKNTITLTGEAKFSPTWDDATGTWDSAVGTWSNPGVILTPESKNYITFTLWASNVLPWLQPTPWSSNSGLIAEAKL